MIRKENSVAFCYLSLPEDERHIVLITEDEMIVRLKNHDKVFALDSVLSISTARKVILFPVIAGGIICPLSLMAAFNNIGNLWLLMSISFAGLLALYYGFAGTDAFILKTRIKDFDFFIETENPYLRTFCHFYNDVLSKSKLDRYYCVEVKKEIWEEVVRRGKLIVSKNGMALKGIDILGGNGKKNDYYFIESPLKNGYKIGYVHSDGNQIHPMLFSDVHIEHLHKIQSI